MIAGYREKFYPYFIEWCTDHSTMLMDFEWSALADNFNFYINEFNESERDDNVIFSLILLCLLGITKDVKSPVMIRVSDELDSIISLVASKNHDYGNSVFMTPILAPHIAVDDAIRVRLSDKFKRFDNLFNGAQDTVGESITDTLRDIVGYLFLYWCY